MSAIGSEELPPTASTAACGGEKGSAAPPPVSRGPTPPGSSRLARLGVSRFTGLGRWAPGRRRGEYPAFWGVPCTGGSPEGPSSGGPGRLGGPAPARRTTRPPPEKGWKWVKLGKNPKKIPYPQCGRSIKTYARGNNDAPSISNYGSLVGLDAQIVAVRALRSVRPLQNPVRMMYSSVGDRRALAITGHWSPNTSSGHKLIMQCQS